MRDATWVTLGCIPSILAMILPLTLPLSKPPQLWRASFRCFVDDPCSVSAANCILIRCLPMFKTTPTSTMSTSSSDNPATANLHSEDASSSNNLLYRTPTVGSVTRHNTWTDIDLHSGWIRSGNHTVDVPELRRRTFRVLVLVGDNSTVAIRFLTSSHRRIIVICLPPPQAQDLDDAVLNELRSRWRTTFGLPR
ncbi:hypothetical protein MKEN_01045300 [Mycena kentingensis (nom. inval.)]|nr:hypothetical protein MKEN_01045300 [Mycena kentingensis (nom. inval.)]